MPDGNGNHPDPSPEPIKLGPHSSWEDLARAYGELAAGLYEKIPRIEEASERIEAAVLVADGAAHRAESSSRKALEEAKRLQEMVRVLEMRVGGAENAADDARKSSHDLEKYLAEAGRILDRRVQDPHDKMDSERARAIADKAIADAKAKQETDDKVKAYDQIQDARKKRRERIVKVLWKVVGAVSVAAGLGGGGILWGQCQREAGRLQGLQEATATSPATSSPPVVPLPFPTEPETRPGVPRAMPEAGSRRP